MHINNRSPNRPCALIKIIKTNDKGNVTMYAEPVYFNGKILEREINFVVQVKYE